MTLTASEMLAKLNELYDLKERLQDETCNKMLELEQVEEDIDVLQTLIMYSANKYSRTKEYLGAKQKWERSLNGRQ